jgi:sRNA-binding carbon storage regulator CsrA
MRVFYLSTDEAIVVGSEIIVRVLGIEGDEVRLGIDSSEDDSIELGEEPTALGQFEAQPVA